MQRTKVYPNVKTDVSILNYPKRGYHLHIRLAKMKCPTCSGSLVMFYSPTNKHKEGKDSTRATQHKLMISCLKCHYIGASVETLADKVILPIENSAPPKYIS